MSIRLHEVGPRLTLKLYKIEEGFLNGTVVYNRIGKPPNELSAKDEQSCGETEKVEAQKADAAEDASRVAGEEYREEERDEGVEQATKRALETRNRATRKAGEKSQGLIVLFVYNSFVDLLVLF